MSTNNDAPDSSAAAAPDAGTVSPADALRALLDAPKPKDEAWQADAGRAVSMLALRFLSETSDESALRIVALLGLAQSLGVKEARKRALKLTRWTEAAPPPLTALAQKDEQHAALGVLAKLTAPWARPYAERALTDLSLPEEFVAELLKWVRATHLDSLSFIRESYAPLVAAAKTAERTSALLKEAGKLLKTGGPEAAANLADGTAALVFARLLPAWNAFVAELPDASRAASLSAMLHQAAGTLGISALGEAGEIVGYDPLSHHLASDDGASPGKVRILRPGVQVRRPDGSSRVLVAALVALA